MKIQIKQDGNVKTFVRYKGIYHNVDDEYILIYYALRDENPGLPVFENEQKPMRVDRMTPVPVVDPEGNPVMATVQQPTGQYEMIQVEIGRDQNNEPIYDQLPDYSHPILEDVQVQKTISEYDAVMWWFWDIRNTSAHSSIEEIIQEGLLRRIGISTAPYAFSQSPEWLALQ